MVTTMKPTNRDWGSISLVIIAGFTAFVTAWNAFNGNDVKQNERLANIERLLCTTDDVARIHACRMSGVKPE
jgi:hypothetical protein